VHEASNAPLLELDWKLNPKVAGPKFGPQMGAIQKALEKLQSTTPIQAPPLTVPLPDGSMATIDPADVWILPKIPKGYAGLADKGTQLLLDSRITPELAREGMAREVIRHVQNSRKDAGLEMEDRIVLYLHTDDAELAKAIAEHRDYIAAETLTSKWADKPLGEGAFRAHVKVDGKALTIELRKA